MKGFGWTVWEEQEGGLGAEMEAKWEVMETNCGHISRQTSHLTPGTRQQQPVVYNNLRRLLLSKFTYSLQSFMKYGILLSHH